MSSSTPPYLNPIIPGFNPDPTIIRVNSSYFLATSTFEYFPGVPIYHSTDLLNWTLIGHALTRPSQLGMRSVEPGGGIFAPTLRWWKGRFYMCVCVVHQLSWDNHKEHVEPRGFYVSTDDIFDETKWSEPVFFDTLGFDQDLFFDDDDKFYLSTTLRTPLSNQPRSSITGLSVYASQIDLPSGRNLTRPVLIRQATTTTIAEGSHIIKKDGAYYLFTAEGGTGDLHQEWVGRSFDSPLGAYEPGPNNPIIFNDQDEQVRTTGHMDFVQDQEGGWWGVLLATRPQKDERAGGKLWDSQLGRETFLVPVEWEKGGWPVLNQGKLVSVEGIASGRRMAKQVVLNEWRDDFEKDTLSLGWYYLRTPLKPFHSLSSPSNYLTLYGNPYTIDQQESPAALFRKQTAFRGKWTTEMEFDPDVEGEEAGVGVWWSRFAFMIMGVRRGEGGDKKGRYVFLRWVDPDSGEHREIRDDQDLAPGPIQFQIKAQPLDYTFSFRPASSSSSTDTSWTRLGDPLSTRILIDQKHRDSIFTGTHWMLYAQGVGGTGCLKPARFGFVEFVGGRDGEEE